MTNECEIVIDVDGKDISHRLRWTVELLPYFRKFKNVVSFSSLQKQEQANFLLEVIKHPKYKYVINEYLNWLSIFKKNYVQWTKISMSMVFQNGNRLTFIDRLEMKHV